MCEYMSNAGYPVISFATDAAGSRSHPVRLGFRVIER